MPRLQDFFDLPGFFDYRLFGRPVEARMAGANAQLRVGESTTLLNVRAEDVSKPQAVTIDFSHIPIDRVFGVNERLYLDLTWGVGAGSSKATIDFCTGKRLCVVATTIIASVRYRTTDPRSRSEPVSVSLHATYLPTSGTNQATFTDDRITVPSETVSGRIQIPAFARRLYLMQDREAGGGSPIVDWMSGGTRLGSWVAFGPLTGMNYAAGAVVPNGTDSIRIFADSGDVIVTPYWDLQI